jgi:hypothetical protein
MPSFYSKIVWFLEDHPRIDAVLMRLFNRQRHWLQAKREWSVGRTFNDGPDEYYWPWKKYWAAVKKVSGYDKS